MSGSPGCHCPAVIRSVRTRAPRSRPAPAGPPGRTRADSVTTAHRKATADPVRPSGGQPRLADPARTGMLDEFTHVTGTDARVKDLDISLAAVLVCKSCNVGLAPIVRLGFKALTRSRLLGWTGRIS